LSPIAEDKEGLPPIAEDKEVVDDGDEKPQIYQPQNNSNLLIMGTLGMWLPKPHHRSDWGQQQDSRPRQPDRQSSAMSVLTQVVSELSVGSDWEEPDIRPRKPTRHYSETSAIDTPRGDSLPVRPHRIHSGLHTTTGNASAINAAIESDAGVTRVDADSLCVETQDRLRPEKVGDSAMDGSNSERSSGSRSRTAQLTACALVPPPKPERVESYLEQDSSNELTVDITDNTRPASCLQSERQWERLEGSFEREQITNKPKGFGDLKQWFGLPTKPQRLDSEVEDRENALNAPKGFGDMKKPPTKPQRLESEVEDRENTTYAPQGFVDLKKPPSMPQRMESEVEELNEYQAGFTTTRQSNMGLKRSIHPPTKPQRIESEVEDPTEYQDGHVIVSRRSNNPPARPVRLESEVEDTNEYQAGHVIANHYPPAKPFRVTSEVEDTNEYQAGHVMANHYPPAKPVRLVSEVEDTNEYQAGHVIANHYPPAKPVRLVSEVENGSED